MSFDVQMATINLEDAQNHLEYLLGVKDRQFSLQPTGATTDAECYEAVDAWKRQGFEVARCKLLLKKAKGEIT